MPVVFGPSDDTASLIGMILSLTLLNGPRNTSRNHCRYKHNPPCHLQIPTKALSCKKEAICEHGPEALSCPVGESSFKMDCFKVEKCSMVRRVQIWHSCWNHGRRVLRAKEEGELPACYQLSIQNPASLMVWGCISAYGMGSLHVLEGTMNAEWYIKVLEQHMLPSRWRLFQGKPCVFQQDNAKPHTAAITTAWLRSRRVRALNWPACSPDLSPIENICRIIKQKVCQRWPRTLQQLETYIRQEWDQIPTSILQKLITSMPRRLQTFWKEEEMLHHGEHAPIPTILRPVAGIKFEMSLFCA